MGRRSSIKALPKSTLDKLHRWIEEGHTLDDLVAALEEMGYEISRSAMHRYRQDVEATFKHLQESREITEILARDLGEDMTSSKQGQLLVEMLRTLVFKSLRSEAEGDGDFEARDAMFFAKAIKEAAQAMRLDQEYASKVRAQIAADAAKAAREVVSEKGLSDEVATSIENKILGIG